MVCAKTDGTNFRNARFNLDSLHKRTSTYTSSLWECGLGLAPVCVRQVRNIALFYIYTVQHEDLRILRCFCSKVLVQLGACATKFLCLLAKDALKVKAPRGPKAQGLLKKKIPRPQGVPRPQGFPRPQEAQSKQDPTRNLPVFFAFLSHITYMVHM